ncbi:BARP protein [Trypanosoma brucei gambiense DAL972]|uniref:BARP protein n=1 Tax=Trypanosoma brucei gambiense (strain MHOM/CI/86/DAL972) TaxID=679716 RepID=C9ZZP1_TRYB9|nr:BARP protein [Trypanosoma brucei gambiense DAL972]XP_011777162.1 BARP protein [Trypanosoma brucei gambiense DAL972]CBH14890.1 BARP protein [Trypanosoma brucei gambiense DAL972]CBH14896.1 BARP protein [Trypanosoma brucei gambiense DAL972]|eukprot:XP_011777156.1 BARP protein [Trypanosoma brucei gambiense DAL972]
MSITFHSLWLLLTVLCTAGIRAHHVWNDCFADGSYPPLEGIPALCGVAEQLRGLPDTVSSALVNAAAASSKAFEAKVQAEEAVELAESRGLNVTKAKEAAVRATLAAEAAATAASNVEINAANIAALPWSQRRQDAGLQKVALCDNVDKDVREAAAKCTKKANNVTAESLRAALEALENLVTDVKFQENLRMEDVEFHTELKSLEEHVEEAVRAQREAEAAAAEANETAGTNTGPVGNSVASPEGSVLLLMAGLFLSSVL